MLGVVCNKAPTAGFYAREQVLPPLTAYFATQRARFPPSVLSDRVGQFRVEF